MLYLIMINIKHNYNTQSELYKASHRAGLRVKRILNAEENGSSRVIVSTLKGDFDYALYHKTEKGWEKI